MDLKVENLDTHEALITITIPEDVVQQTRRDVARKLSKQIRIPGFRPGMAPLSVVIGAVGEQSFANEFADALGSKYYAQAIEEANVDPYGPGQLEDLKTDPTRMIVRVPLEPTVDIKDYKAVRVPYEEPVVADEEIESQLQFIREDNAVVELAERPAQLGDLVEADIEVSVDGKDVMHNHRPIVLDESRMGLPGLAEAVVGMSAGEHKDAPIVIPEDYQDELLRGKQASAAIDVKRVSSRTLPDINDELAQTVGSFSTLADLRTDLRTRLVDYKSRNAELAYQTQVLDAFTNLSTISYPRIYVDDRLDEMVKELKDDVSRDEKMPFDEWLKVQNKTEQQVREDLRPNAETRCKRGLVMRDLARVEGIHVTDDEIAAEVERTAQQYSGSNNAEVRRMLMQEDSRRAMQNSILSTKVLRRMAEIARGAGSAAEDANGESTTTLAEPKS